MPYIHLPIMPATEIDLAFEKMIAHDKAVSEAYFNLTSSLRRYCSELIDRNVDVDIIKELMAVIKIALDEYARCAIHFAKEN